DWDDGHTRTAQQGALARSPGGAGELLLVALQLLVHAAPQWTWAAAADRVAIERGHGLHFARRGRDPYLVGGAQLRFADRLHAASNGGARGHFLHGAAGGPGKDAPRGGGHQHLAAEH